MLVAIQWPLKRVFHLRMATQWPLKRVHPLRGCVLNGALVAHWGYLHYACVVACKLTKRYLKKLFVSVPWMAFNVLAVIVPEQISFIQDWHDATRLNYLCCKPGTCLSCMSNALVSDDLATQAGKPSTSIVLTSLSRKILMRRDSEVNTMGLDAIFSAQEGFKINLVKWSFHSRIAYGAESEDN